MHSLASFTTSVMKVLFPIGYWLLAIGYSLFFASCRLPSEKRNDRTPVTTETKTSPKISAPQFNSDSAFLFVKQQVDFGPRVPGTLAHEKCADYLAAKLRSYKLDVIVQKGMTTAYDNRQFELKNIIGAYKPELKDRVLLCAHWDCRPIADRDTKDTDKPIDGANDGASGVGVLLEIARNLNTVNPNIGVDIIFFDIEDYGQPHVDDASKENTWCLGSQYWARNPHRLGYYAKYGILLDMVGAAGATFMKEGGSEYYAPSVVTKVWNKAEEIGYSDYFSNIHTSAITDDHYYINTIAAIPTIDIIHMDTQTRDFFPFHHKHGDNMSVIDKNTLKAVGQTVMEVVYAE